MVGEVPSSGAYLAVPLANNIPGTIFLIIFYFLLGVIIINTFLGIIVYVVLLSNVLCL